MHSDNRTPVKRQPAIGIYQVGKTYRVYNSSLSRLQGHLLDAMPKPFGFLRKFSERLVGHSTKLFAALDDITLQIQKGESVGIIGRNGSGKSTLLQIIAGTRPPTSGSVQVQGRVAAILELGSGFKPDFTGRENVFINGLILGLSRGEVEARFDRIATFADIGGFMDQPVKTYSSGMLVRLVFAVQASLDPDVLVVDEALAVGDVFFQQKCARRLYELKEKGTTILFVSHSMQVVRNLCEKVLYLRDGRMVFYGPTIKGTALYFSGGGDTGRKRLGRSTETAKPDDRPAIWRRSEPVEAPASIRALRLSPDAGIGSLQGRIGEVVCLDVEIESHHDVTLPVHLGFSIQDSFGKLVTSRGTHTQGDEAYLLEPAASATFRVTIPLNLETGDYTFNIGIGNMEGVNKWIKYHGTGWNGPLTISWASNCETQPFYGRFGLPVLVENMA